MKSLRPSFIAKSTLLLATFFAIDKALALARQMIIGRVFGLSAELDAFNAANNLPDMLFALISGGALAMAFIPVLSEHLTRHGRPAMWDLFSRVANLVFLVTAGLSALLALLAGPLVRHLVAPGFPPDLQNLAVALMRLDLLGTLIFSLSGLVTAGLQANQHFLLPALAPAMYNLGQIFGAAMLAPRQPVHLGPLTWDGLGLGIYGLVYGVLLGAALHLGVQVPGLLRYGFRWAPRIGLRHPGVIQVLHLMGPRVATMAFIQAIFIARDHLASYISIGAVSALAYGWFIMQVPETLLGTALSTVLLPTLSEHAAAGRWEAWKDTFTRGFRALLAVTLPAAGVLSVALPGLIPLLGFDAAGVRLVTWTTRAYLVGMTGHALLELIARGFYARQNALTPLFASGINTALYLTLALLFGRHLGAPGIGLANALAFTTEALLLLALQRREMAWLPPARSALFKGLGGAALGALVGWGVLHFAPGPLLARGALAAVAGACATVPFWWREVWAIVRMA